MNARMNAVGIVLAALSLACTGCAYRGAIYASYQEAGLGMKATAESNSPVKVHFGYDRGVGAWVPRRGGGDEEATSLISRDDVRAGVNPTKTDEPLLQTDGVVIAGTAAIVASAPTAALVRVVEADRVMEVRTQGTAGDRIATALTQVALTTDQGDLKELIDDTAKRADKDAVFRAAAANASDKFQRLFRERLAAGDDALRAFERATFKYMNESSDARATRVAETLTALRSARKD
jgi:hypothetical protein